MSEPHKDFLALTHGEEWVNFYESFDKLVQDNLARSSDLLKRAMTLPEVADREVAQIRTEHESVLAAEQNRQRAVLSDLRDEITGSHLQVSALAKGMFGVIADLERLSGRITSALAAVEPQSDNPTPPEPTVVQAEAPAANAEPPEVPAAEAASEQAPSPATEAASEPAAPADASSIDLTALAEAEVETAPVGEPTADLVAASNGSSAERQRPHWLSVTRLGTPGNN